MAKRDLISVHDLSAQEFAGLLQLASEVKSEPEKYSSALAGQTLGMIFQKSSKT